MVVSKIMNGNHLTPLGQDIKWQPGKEFNPIDALGQWFRQEVYRDLNELNRTIAFWLNPVSTP